MMASGDLANYAHIGEFFFVIGGSAFAWYKLRTKTDTQVGADVQNIKSWIKEHKDNTDLGYRRLAAVENCTAQLTTLIEQHEKRLDRVERRQDAP